MSDALIFELYENDIITLDEAIDLILLPDEQEQIDHNSYAPFDINSFNDAELKFNFRFTHDQIMLLAEKLWLPDEIRTSNRYLYGPVEALCVLLYRLRYPCRLGDMIPVFGGRSR